MLVIEVDLSGSRPVYQQITDQLRGLIARGALADGAELPSVRALASDVGVNLNTVAKAYRALADEGLVELRHGSRARVARRPVTHTHAHEDEVATRLVDEALSRLVLRGADREKLMRFFDAAVKRFFARMKPEPGGSK